LYQIDEHTAKGTLMQIHLPQARESLQAECNTTVATLLVHFLRISFHDSAEFYGIEAQFSQTRQGEVILHKIIHTAEHRLHLYQKPRDLHGAVSRRLVQLIFEHINEDEERSQRITDIVRQGTGETP